MARHAFGQEELHAVLLLELSRRGWLGAFAGGVSFARQATAEGNGTILR